METSIRVFFGRFAVYIIAALLAVSAIGYTGWYVSTLKLENAVAERNNTEMRLSESNASYKSIRDQFGLLTNELKANQERALASHALLQENVKRIIESDKSRVAFEQALLTRQPVTNCETPKEVLDAWKRL